MDRVLDSEKDRAIRRLYEDGVSIVSASRKLDVGEYAVRTRFQRWRLEEKAAGVVEAVKELMAEPESEPDPEPETQQKEWIQEGNKARGEWITQEFVETEADLVRVCKIDTTRWKIVRLKVKPYQVGMKLTTKEQAPSGVIRKIQEVPHRLQLFSITAEMELILPEPYLQATEALFRRLESRAPLFPDLPPLPRPESSPYIAVVNLFDAHFGKLCWAPETGDNYDLKIAAAVFRNAVLDLLDYMGGFRIGRIVFNIGHDLHHVDTLSRTTTAGTPQDADGRYFKMVDVVEGSVLWACEEMMRVAFLDAIYMGGNHDRIASWHTCRTVKAYFRNATDRVDVDISPRVRKYRRYGVNLFGFTHGHQVRDPKSLVNLMAIEAANEWSQTKCRQWFLGHEHTTKNATTKQSGEFNGVEIHWGPSTAGTDAYHFEEGYIGNQRAAEAFLYSPDRGRIGHFVAEARTA